MRSYTLATPLVLAALTAVPALAQTQGAPSSVQPRAVPGTTGITQVPGSADSDAGSGRGSGVESGAKSVSPSAKPSGGTGPVQGGGGPNGQGSAAPDQRSDAAPRQVLRLAQAQTGTAQQETPAPAPGGQAPGGQAMAQAPAQADARVERQLQGLYTRLRITAAEQPQWNAFASTMQANAQQMSQLWSARQGGNTSALDDMRGYAQIAQAHAEGMQRLVAAFAPLYESLSPEQKAAADQAFRNAARQNGRRVPP